MNVALKESHVLINPNFLTIRKPLFWANGMFIEFVPKKWGWIFSEFFCHDWEGYLKNQSRYISIISNTQWQQFGISNDVKIPSTSCERLHHQLVKPIPASIEWCVTEGKRRLGSNRWVFLGQSHHSITDSILVPCICLVLCFMFNVQHIA